MLSDSSLERQSHNESQNSTQKFGANALPERLQVSIGGHFGPSYSVHFDGDSSLTYTRTKRREKDPWEIGSSEKWETKSEPVRPTQGRWAAFRAELDRLNVWCWQPEYFEPVCDGTGWSAEIVYSDKAIRSHGSNCFPGEADKPVSIVDRAKGDTFDQFCRAVSCMVGRPFR
jgi:hypothetical protein